MVRFTKPLSPFTQEFPHSALPVQTLGTSTACVCLASPVDPRGVLHTPLIDLRLKLCYPTTPDRLGFIPWFTPSFTHLGSCTKLPGPCPGNSLVPPPQFLPITIWSVGLALFCFLDLRLQLWTIEINGACLPQLTSPPENAGTDAQGPTLGANCWKRD